MSESKYEKIYRLANEKTGRARWMETAIFPLAADLEELTGQPVVVSGPFGLRAAVYIKLGKSTITITPGFQDDRLELLLRHREGDGQIRAPHPRRFQRIQQRTGTAPRKARGRRRSVP